MCNGGLTRVYDYWDTQRHASNNNILVGDGAGGSLARRYARPTRESRDRNANVARTHTHTRLPQHALPAHARHDNTLDIILKPLIESTQ